MDTCLFKFFLLSFSKKDPGEMTPKASPGERGMYCVAGWIFHFFLLKGVGSRRNWTGLAMHK